MGMGMLEPNLPGYMLVVMHADTWLQGIAFLPASISYLIGTIVFGPLGAKIGRYVFPHYSGIIHRKYSISTV